MEQPQILFLCGEYIKMRRLLCEQILTHLQHQSSQEPSILRLLSVPLTLWLCEAPGDEAKEPGLGSAQESALGAVAAALPVLCSPALGWDQ